MDDHGGLVTEFDLCIRGGPASDLPSGFAAAAVGGGFLKIGVGELQKEAEHYNFQQHPRLLVPATTTASWEAAAAHFHQTCDGVDGYAYELWVDLAVSDDRIQVDWRLANRGVKDFTTRQYAHNFLRFDERNIGPDYVLSFPYDISVTGNAAELGVGLREICFAREIPRWVNLSVAWPSGYAGANTCVLSHLGNGLGVTCTTSVPGIRTAIHARSGYCAPEQFIAISFAPGKERAWSRGWTFTLGPPRP